MFEIKTTESILHNKKNKYNCRNGTLNSLIDDIIQGYRLQAPNMTTKSFPLNLRGSMLEP